MLLEPHYQYHTGPVQSQPHPQPPPRSPPHPYGSHPFVLESPSRQHERAAQLAAFQAADRDLFGGARVYSYGDPSQPPTHRGHGASRGPFNPPSVSSRGDVHFASTLSQQQLQSHLAHSQALHWQAQQTQQWAPQAAFAPERSQPLTPAARGLPAHVRHLSVHVHGADDPLSRTIPTPMPVAHTHTQQGREDEEERERTEMEAAHSRRVPLAPQTPRVLEGPASTAVLRQTPRARARTAHVASPYSREFGF